MKISLPFVSLVVALSLWGCGGETGARTSIVTGTVVDSDFNPVRGATVKAAGRSTTTSSTGAYQLTDVLQDEVEIIAELRDGNQTYRGRTWIINTPDQQQRSVNIVVGNTNNLATVRGTIRDRDGFLLQGASVFAYFGTGSSARAISDRNGNFTLRDMVANVNYSLSASGQGFRSDQTTVVLANGETRNLNFVLDNPGLPALSPPQNIGGNTWVSYPGTTRSAGQSSALDWVRAHKNQGKDTKFASRSRAIRDDMIVETELFWDQNNFADKFGYGVYRGNGFNGSLQAIDFYFDPLAPYYQDLGLNPNSSYSYALTTISTLYPDFGGQTESNLSSRVNLDTLNLLRVNNVTKNPLRFNWQSGSGATDFVIYIFDQFPDIGVQAIFNNEGSPATGTSWVYTGPNLNSGQTYYYIILGGANGFSSRTISQVESFIR